MKSTEASPECLNQRRKEENGYLSSTTLMTVPYALEAVPSRFHDGRARCDHITGLLALCVTWTGNTERLTVRVFDVGTGSFQSGKR